MRWLNEFAAEDVANLLGTVKWNSLKSCSSNLMSARNEAECTPSPLNTLYCTSFCVVTPSFARPSPIGDSLMCLLLVL